MAMNLAKSTGTGVYFCFQDVSLFGFKRDGREPVQLYPALLRPQMVGDPKDLHSPGYTCRPGYSCTVQSCTMVYPGYSSVHIPEVFPVDSGIPWYSREK